MLRRPIPRVLHTLVVALVIAGLGVTVWRLGGFEPRSDQRTVVGAGTLLAAGPFELTFTYATAQRRIDSSETVTWVVTAEGQGRTTADESLAPNSDMFAARDPGSGEVQETYSKRFGPASLIGGGRFFTPGLPPVPFAVVFNFTDAYVPGGPLRLAVADQEYRDPSLIGHDEKLWRNTDENWVMDLPVRLLAEDA